MIPIYGPYSTEDIPSGSELLIHPFPFRAIRAVQIFVLEFSKDGLGDEFADCGEANQPLVLQGGVGLSSDQVSWVMASLRPTSSGFLILVT